MSPDDIPFVPAAPADNELTTLTLTVRERCIIAHALTITAALAEALEPETVKLHLGLWERVMEGVPS